MEDTKDQILNFIKEVNPSNPIQYVHNIVKDFAREKLDEQIIKCQDCSICNGPKSITYGNTNAAILIVGDTISEEQANEESNEIKFPLFDSAGDTLNKALDTLNVNKEQLFYINAVNCWPSKAVGKELITRTPTKQETLCCKTFVDYAIEIVQPLVIITLGNIALNLFQKESITKARGQWFDIKGIPTMPTYHPGYFDKIAGVKDEEMIEMLQWDFFEDLGQAFKYITEKYPGIKIFNEEG